MKFRKLRQSGLNVSEIGFGMWTISTGWWGKFTEGEAISMMHKAMDLGINLYDAADTYGNGRGESGQRDSHHVMSVSCRDCN